MLVPTRFAMGLPNRQIVADILPLCLGSLTRPKVSPGHYAVVSQAFKKLPKFAKKPQAPIMPRFNPIPPSIA